MLNNLAQRLYDGELDSSFLREPLPPPRADLPEGAIDNCFKRLVDQLIMRREQQLSRVADANP